MDHLLLAMRALGPARILALFLGLAAVIAIMGMVMKDLRSPGMSLMYGGLAPEEAVGISQWIENQGIEYEVRGDGSIYVPMNKVGDLRLRAAGQGLVGSSTTGYEIFDKSSGFGTTSFVQNINARRALEGELSRTITSLPAVSGARVHLVMPQRRLFEQEASKPSAAVALNLSGRLLAGGQVENIARLVASAVPQLTMDNITVIDQSGNLMFDGRGNASSGSMIGSHAQGDIQKNYEKKLTSMLEKVVGPGKVSVKVTAILNNDRVEEQSEIFDPNQQVVRSEQRVEDTTQSQSSNPAGAVGLTGNLPEGGGAASSNTDSDNQSRTEETVSYEISRTIRNLIREGGEIKRLSVAVLLEGRYETEAGSENPIYKAYTEEDLDQFTKLVKTAIGFNEGRGDKVEIIDMPFSQMPEFEEVVEPFMSKGDIFMVAQYVMLLMGLILVMLFVIRPAMDSLNKAITVVVPSAQAATQSHNINVETSAGVSGDEVVPSSTVSIEKVEGRVRESMVNQVNEIVDQHPEESLSVVRSWMADAVTTSSNES